MNRFVITCAVAAVLSGCAQNQMPESQGPLGFQPTVKEFESCGLSVRFSGQPDVIQASVADSFQELFDAKPEGQSWIYRSHIQGVSKTETAFCVCPPKEKLQSWKHELNHTSFHVEGVGTTFQVPTTEIDGGSKVLMKTTVSDSAPDCVFVQMVVAIGNTDAISRSATPFFASISPMPTKQETTAIFRSDGSAASKAKQLEQWQKWKQVEQPKKDSDDPMGKLRQLIEQKKQSEAKGTTSANSSDSNPGKKTTEQRLAELRGLLDKGLINQDQYNRKSTEIIKDF